VGIAAVLAQQASASARVRREVLWCFMGFSQDDGSILALRGRGANPALIKGEYLPCGNASLRGLRASTYCLQRGGSRRLRRSGVSLTDIHRGMEAAGPADIVPAPELALAVGSGIAVSMPRGTWELRSALVPSDGTHEIISVGV